VADEEEPVAVVHAARPADAVDERVGRPVREDVGGLVAIARSPLGDLALQHHPRVVRRGGRLDVEGHGPGVVARHTVFTCVDIPTSRAVRRMGSPWSKEPAAWSRG
jgi:hypothetical protein